MPKPFNHKELIKLEDTSLDMFHKLSEGNPGALSVLMSLYKQNSRIDPDDFMAEFGKLLSLDTLGIYGPNIWVLFKDCCGQDIAKVITVLRAVQLGLYSEAELWNSIDKCSLIDVTPIHAEVKKVLIRFGDLV